MRKPGFPLLMFLLAKNLILFGAGTNDIVALQDTLKDKQELYNGSLWIDYLSLVNGDQFLFDRSFLPGCVSMRGKTFHVNLRYDIYEDELQTPAGQFGVLRINKEMVDSFSLVFNEKKYRFISSRAQKEQKNASYYNVIFQGKISLYVSHQKKLDKHSVNEGNARFYQFSRLYLVKGDAFQLVRSRKEMIELMKDNTNDVKVFIKKHKLKLSVKNPESFEPLIRYYNSLKGEK